jgi:L-iditol 2-dehydrogenase
MRAAFYSRESDDIEIRDVDIPSIGPGEILLRPMSVGLCTSELIPGHLKKGGSLGHELAGVVEKCGAGVRDLREGERVFIHHHVGCLNCHFCRRGKYTMCPQYHEFGFDPTGYAEYTRIEERHVRIGAIALPDRVTFDEASVIEPASCVFRAIRTASLSIGDTVFVIGAGFIGLVAIQLMKFFGAGRVFASDAVASKLERAEEFGSDMCVDLKEKHVVEKIRDANEGRMADLVMVTAPTLRAVQDALAYVERGGTVIQFGGTPPDGTVPVNPYEFIVRELTYLGTYSSSHIDARATLDLIAQGKLDVKSLITDHFPLRELKEAMDFKRRSSESLKVVIHPNSSS